MQISETKIEVSPESKKGYPRWGLPRGTHLRNANQSCSRNKYVLNGYYLRVQISKTKIEVSLESKKGYPTWGLPKVTLLGNTLECVLVIRWVSLMGATKGYKSKKE